MINENAEAELCAVCDIRPREELGMPDSLPLFTTIKELLAHCPEVEVVNICTPNGLHAEMAIEVLQAGRHVVIEKPLALSTADAEAVKRAELQSGKTVFMVLQNRYSASSQWLRSIVSDGILGDILMVNLNCLWNRDERYYTPGNWHGTQDMDGGTLFTQYSHFIDLMQWICGSLHSIDAANFADFKHQDLTDFEDSGTILFRLGKDGKTLGTLLYSTAVSNSNVGISMTIVGSEGTVVVGGQYLNEVRVCNIKDYTMPELPVSPRPNDYGGYQGSAANHQFVIQNIIDTLRHGAKPTASVDDGICVVDFIEKAYHKRDTQETPKALRCKYEYN